MTTSPQHVAPDVPDQWVDDAVPRVDGVPAQVRRHPDEIPPWNSPADPQSESPPLAASQARASGSDAVGEYVAAPGMPGRGVALLSLAALGAAAGVNVVLAHGLLMFFDLCFVVVCLVASAAVRRRDFFTAGVLPPLLLAVVVAGVALTRPAVFDSVGGAFEAFMTGLAQHALGLLAGYTLALGTLGGRIVAARAR